MAEKITIDIDAKIEAAQSIADLKELKRLLKDTAAGSADFKKLANGIDDLEDKIKGAKNTSADWIDSLESAGGPLGALGAGINKAKVATQTFGGALKATGIGLIVGLIGGLVAAFSKTEGSLKKLEPITIAFEKTLGGVVAAVEPLLEGFAELALKVMPYVTDAFKVAYSAVTAVFQSLGKIGQAVGKLIKGDFAGAWDTAKESVTGFKDNFIKAEARFEEGYKKTTATQKKNFEEQEKLRQEALQKRLKELESQDKLDEAQLAKQKAIALSLAQTEQEKLDVEKAFIEKSYKLKEQDLKDKQLLYKVGTAEYKDYQAQLVQLDTERTTSLTATKEKQTEITKAEVKKQFDAEISALDLKKAQGLVKEEEYQKGIYDLAVKYGQEAQAAFIKYETYKTETRKKSAEDARTIALSEIQDSIDNLMRLNELVDFDYQEDQLRLEQIKTDLEAQKAIELSNLELTEKEKNEIIKKYAKEEQEIDKELTASKKAEVEARTQLNLTFANSVGALGSLLQQAAGDNKGLAIAGILIEQAAGIASIVINAKKNFIKDGGIKSPLAWANAAVAATSVIAAGLAAKKGIEQINQTKIPGGSMGASSSGGGGGGSISFAGSVAPVPQSPGVSGVNPSTQIAQSLANATGKPVKAYVVGSDISSQQAMDRRTNSASTFSAG